MTDIEITNSLEDQGLVRDMKRLIRHLLRKGSFPRLNDKTVRAVYAMSQCLFLSYVVIDSRQNGVYIAYATPDDVTKAGRDFIGWKDEGPESKS